MTEKSVQEAEYWKRTALRKDIEIQSMKINKNLDLGGEDDNRSSMKSQKSNLNLSAQQKNELNKTDGDPNAENKNKMFLDLRKIQDQIN